MGLSLLYCLLYVFLQIYQLPDEYAMRLTAQKTKTAHPLYVSVTELYHNQQTKNLEISCKFFADDFEKTLNVLYNTAVDVTKSKDSVQVEKLAFDYLQKHLLLKINGRLVNFQFIGHEKEEESVWCYLQIANIPSVKKIDITNNLLYDMYTTQMSIMHASSGGVRKSSRLVYPDKYTSFDF